MALYNLPTKLQLTKATYEIAEVLLNQAFHVIASNVLSQHGHLLKNITVAYTEPPHSATHKSQTNIQNIPTIRASRGAAA